jgi:hypothetical protein
MANFPTLKTGAVAQYPLGHTWRFSTQSVRFMDGSRQRYPIYANALRRWTIRLNDLDESELGALISFAEQQQGATFAFTDPVTGETVSNCIVSASRFSAGMTQEIDGQASIVIEEIA